MAGVYRDLAPFFSSVQHRAEAETYGSDSLSWLLRVDLNHQPQHYEGGSSTLTYYFN